MKNTDVILRIVLLLIVLHCCYFSHAQKTTTSFVEFTYKHEPKVKPAFIPLPFGSVEAKGWLRDWIFLMKDGLVGHSVAFNKGWINGMPSDFFGEQTAYWIDGMLRTGYAIHDEELINRAKNDIDGFLKNRKFVSSWSMAVYGRAIMAYYQATGDTSVLNAMTDLYRNSELAGFWEIIKMYGNVKLVFGEGVTTSAKEIAKNEPRNLIQTEPMLEAFYYGADSVLLKRALDGMKKYDTRFINHFLWRDRETCFNNNGCFLSMHGVTYNEFAKIWAMAYLYNGNPDYLQTSVNAYKELDENNMMPNGVNSSHENLMGVDAIGSSETCDISDFIHSNIIMYRIVGNSSYGDKIERALFNAGASAMSYDCKTHVYLQSPNRLKLAKESSEKGHYEYKSSHQPLCCTGNVTRLIPDYILHMWMATPDNGLVASMYGPSEVTLKVGNNVPIKINEATSYPFDESIILTLETQQSVEFPLYLRIPKWCKSPNIIINGKAFETKINESGFAIVTRHWKNNDQVHINFPMEINCVTGITKSNGAKSSLDAGEILTPDLPYTFIERGPLLYTLMITDENTKYRFALVPSLKKYEFKKATLPKKFSWGNIPLSISVSAQPYEWRECPKLPKQFIKKTDKTEFIKLVPYGCSQGVRITMFPVVK